VACSSAQSNSADDNDDEGHGSSSTAATTTTGAPTSTDTTDTTTTSSASSSESSGANGFVAGEDASITIFAAEHLYYTEEENRQQVDTTVTLPEPGFVYEKILLNFAVTCPPGGCDDWDRIGWFGIVLDPDTEQEQVLEIGRFMTPYGVGATWQLDVTELQPILAGEIRFRVYTSTWVGPGHANGAGWLFHAQLDYTGGIPDPVPVEVIPLWALGEVPVGDPAILVEDSVPPQTIDLPEGSTFAAIRATITGHGQGNALNCAEFCQLEHSFVVNDTAYKKTIWRDNCEDTPVTNQGGTWQFDRAGWCPGAEVIPWLVDVSDSLTGSEVSLAYSIADYENTCRPDAIECSGCTLGNGCEYNGGTHTLPRYLFSAALIAYQGAESR
jgi:hypothetical protein